jgi:hypothetical protein
MNNNIRRQRQARIAIVLHVRAYTQKLTWQMATALYIYLISHFNLSHCHFLSTSFSNVHTELPFLSIIHTFLSFLMSFHPIQRKTMLQHVLPNRVTVVAMQRLCLGAQLADTYLLFPHLSLFTIIPEPKGTIQV